MWRASHDQAQRLSVQAASSRLRGSPDESSTLFSDAAELEECAWEEAPASAVRTRGILAVSSAALMFKAGRFQDCAEFAAKVLATTDVNAAHREQLEELRKDAELEAEWTEEDPRLGPTGADASPLRFTQDVPTFSFGGAAPRITGDFPSCI
jgi:hypothetical protein